ncbi:hypothetical protein BU17DRAFT_96670 [Hysterangium stoloniferum]|nr:hypothetical protein BU17DRAFT_96670 [Hysterangium stoloniferum]
MTTRGTSLEDERRQQVVAEDKETNAMMAAAIKGFENYIKYLATGKLDGYLDSTRCEDKLTDLEVKLPLNPSLLLHDLGNHPDKDRIERLFIRNTVHLFGISGSTSGSKGFEVVTEEMLPTVGTLPSLSPCDVATDRVSAMLLCSRIFILKQFVQHIPVNTDATLAWRRWVLAQVLPPHLDFWGDNLFIRVLRALQPADMQIMRDIIASTLSELKTKRKDLFPDGRDTSLFVVIDEVQVAVDHLKEYTNTGTDMHPILDGETPISPELSVLISNHQPINELDRIFNEKNREELIQCLVEILRQWTLGSEPTAITNKNHMHDMIAWGLGVLDKTMNPWKFKTYKNYPVSISEPLKGGKPDRYAQVPYPNLVDDLTASLEMVLGPAVYTPIADIYRSKLHSSIQAQQQSASHSMRQTPRFLRIIATPDNEQQKFLKGEWKGDVAVLQWDVGTLYEFNGRNTEGHSAPF